MVKLNKPLSIGQAAEYLGVTAQTLRRWDESGRLPALRSAGGHRYYSPEDIERYKEELPRLAQIWAASGIAPSIPDQDYSESQDSFRARLERMGTLIDRNPSISGQAPLVTAIAGEIGTTIPFDHNLGNWPDVPGVFFAYDLNKRLVVLADRGVGIKATLSRVRPDLTDDSDALQVAMTEFMSGRAPERRGNGLKFVRTVATDNPIGVSLQSGTAVATIDKDNPKALKINLADQNIRGVLTRIEF